MKRYSTARNDLGSGDIPADLNCLGLSSESRTRLNRGQHFQSAESPAARAQATYLKNARVAEFSSLVSGGTKQNLS
jgi:hypothetical protein